MNRPISSSLLRAPRALLAFITLFLTTASARAEEDLGTFVLDHIIDAKYWYVTPWGPKVYFPSWNVFGIEMGLSLHILMMLITAGLLLLLLLPAARRPTLAPPTRLAHMIEAFVIFIRDEVVTPNLGAKEGRKWLPFFLTIFFFILTLNLLGLVPGMGTATSNINFTAAFALMIFGTFNAAGILKNGPVHYFVNLIPKGLPFWLLPLMVVIEFVGLFTKAIALALRLFANLTAGHALIFSLLGLIIVFKSHLAAVPLVPFTLFIYLIEILVAFLQAYIFTLLSGLFIGQAVHQEH
jgi:F-type H+-transporting ATPase subunit a